MFPIPLESEERKEMESDGDGFCGSERGGAGTSAAFGSAQDHEKIRTREAIENVSFPGPARLSGPCINGGGMFSGCRAKRPPARPRLCVRARAETRARTHKRICARARTHTHKRAGLCLSPSSSFVFPLDLPQPPPPSLSLYMHVCMHACMHVYVYVYVYVCIYAP